MFIAPLHGSLTNTVQIAGEMDVETAEEGTWGITGTCVPIKAGLSHHNVKIKEESPAVPIRCAARTFHRSSGSDRPDLRSEEVGDEGLEQETAEFPLSACPTSHIR